MASYLRKIISCACCGNEYETRMLIGFTIRREDVDLDTNPHNPALFDKIIICPHCGYVTSEPNGRIDDLICSVVYSPNYQKLRSDSTLDLTAKKLLLAGLLYSSVDKIKEAAYSYLYAYWYQKEHNHADAVSTCEKAINSFEKYLSDNENHEMAMILVDLLRQMSLFDEALETLGSLDFYTVNEPNYKAISTFEKRLIIDKDCIAHRLSEVTI